MVCCTITCHKSVVDGGSVRRECEVGVGGLMVAAEKSAMVGFWKHCQAVGCPARTSMSVEEEQAVSMPSVRLQLEKVFVVSRFAFFSRFLKTLLRHRPTIWLRTFGKSLCIPLYSFVPKFWTFLLCRRSSPGENFISCCDIGLAVLKRHCDPLLMPGAQKPTARGTF